MLSHTARFCFMGMYAIEDKLRVNTRSVLGSWRCQMRLIVLFMYILYYAVLSCLVQSRRAFVQALYYYKVLHM